MPHAGALETSLPQSGGQKAASRLSENYRVSETLGRAVLASLLLPILGVPGLGTHHSSLHAASSLRFYLPVAFPFLTRSPVTLDLGLPCFDLILTSSRLQTPSFQTRGHSQVPGAGTSVCLWGTRLSLHHPLESCGLSDPFVRGQWLEPPCPWPAPRKGRLYGGCHFSADLSLGRSGFLSSAWRRLRPVTLSSGRPGAAQVSPSIPGLH